MTPEQARYALWQLGDLSYLYEEGQVILEKKLFDMLETAVDDEVILLASRRYGKSFYLMLFLFSQCLKKEGLRTCVVAPSMEDAKKIINPITDDIMNKMPSPHFANRKTSNYVINFYNGSSIVVAGADVGASKIRGRGFDIVVCEESAAWKPENYNLFMRNVLKPTLIRSKEKVKIIHATTPSPTHIDHPLHALFDKKPTVRLTIYDNPKFDKATIDKIIDDCGGVDSHAYRVEYMCQITRNEELTLLPAFDDNRHVIESIDTRNCYLLASFDSGGTKDRSAYVEAVLTNDQIRVVYSRDWPPMTPVDDVVNFLRTRKYNKIIGDVLGQVEVEYAQRGMYFVHPSKSDFETMLVELNAAFRNNEIAIEFCDENINLIEQCQAGMFNNTRKDFGRTEKFGHCDLIAALNYLYRMRKYLIGARNNALTRASDENMMRENSNGYWKLEKKRKAKNDNLQKLVRR